MSEPEGVVHQQMVDAWSEARQLEREAAADAEATSAPSKPSPSAAPSTPQESPAYYPAEYADVIPKETNWDPSQLGSFLGAARDAHMPPPLVQTCLRGFTPTVEHIRASLAGGEGFDSCLQRTAESLKARLESAGATPEQSRRIILHFLNYVEGHLDEMFPSEQPRQTTPAPAARPKATDRERLNAILAEQVAMGKHLQNTPEYQALQREAEDLSRKLSKGRRP